MRRDTFHSEFGQELIEYALVLPFFLVLVFGILDLGRAAFYFSAINNAARDGARDASLQPPESLSDENSILNSVINKVQYWGNIDSNDVSICWISNYVDDLDRFVTEEVRVSVSFPMGIVTPFIGRFFNNTNEITLSTSSTMHLEYYSINFLANECSQ